MILLSRRSLLAIAAVVDIALHARPTPVAAKLLAARHALPPRHLETLLQTLVRVGILKGVRGPRGGYELARERRKITAGEIARAAMQEAIEEGLGPEPQSRLVDEVIGPDGAAGFGRVPRQRSTRSPLRICAAGRRRAAVFGEPGTKPDFTI